MVRTGGGYGVVSRLFCPDYTTHPMMPSSHLSSIKNSPRFCRPGLNTRNVRCEEEKREHRDIALALDFDGVIFKNAAAMEQVSVNASEFAKMKLTASGYDGNVSEILNRKYYSSFGHSTDLINRISRTPNSTTATIGEYNSFVFEDNLNYEYIASCVDDNDIDLGAQWRDLIERCRDSGIDVFVFSNSPTSWCLNVASAIGLRNVIHENMCICTDNLGGFWKPQAEAFSIAKEKIAGDTIFFVDDSMVNVTCSLAFPGWRPILFSDNFTELGVSDSLSTASSVAHLSEFIDIATTTGNT